MAVNIHAVPPNKLGKAFDAGTASTKPREAVKRDENGMPVLGDDGRPKMVRIRRPPNQKWVTSTGSVIHVRHTDGSPSRHAPTREAEVFAKMHGARAIRYGVCPLRDQYSVMWLPRDMRSDTPCEPGTYNERKCCKHVEAVIAQRSAQHSAQEAKREAANRPLLAKQMEQERTQHKELVNTIIGAISEQRNTNRRGGRGE